MSGDRYFNTTTLESGAVANFLEVLINVWEYSPQVRIHTNSIRIFVTYVLTVQGTLGNIITMVVVSRNGLRTTTNILLFSLCFFDGVYSACCLVSQVIDHFSESIVFFLVRPILIEFWPIINIVSKFAILTSFHIVALISVERFIAVCLPLTVSSIVTPLRFKCVMVVILLYVVTLVSFRYTSSRDYLVALVFVKNKITHTNIDGIYRFKMLFLIYSFTLVTPLPLCVVVLCTSMTIVRLVFKRDMTNCSAGKKTSKEMRAVKLMLNVCVLHVLLLLPVTCMLVYNVLVLRTRPIHQMFVLFCYQLNASVNLFVYVIHSPRFTRGLTFSRCQKRKHLT